MNSSHDRSGYPDRGLFIAGTNTEVGKTYVAGLIAKSLVAAGHRVGVYKPVASGCIQEGDRLMAQDALALWRAAGEPGELDNVCPQRFAAPLAPHLSARAEGKAVDAELLRGGLTKWRDRCDIVLVEGAGGLLSPVTDDEYVADLAYDFGYPLIIVAPNELGVINQTLQTLITAAAFREGLPVAGIVLNDLAPAEESATAAAEGAADPSRSSNRREIELRAGAPVLAHVTWQAAKFDPPVDWLRLGGGR